MISPDGVAPSWVVGVSASVNLPLHHKVQEFSSGTGSLGLSRKNSCKRVVVVVVVEILTLFVRCTAVVSKNCNFELICILMY